MAKISVRVTDSEESEIRKSAQKNSMCISEFLRNRIFEQEEYFQNDNFLIKQKICEIEKNQKEMINAMFEMTKRIRLSANVSIAILQKLEPEKWTEKITKIEKSVEDAMKE